MLAFAGCASLGFCLTAAHDNGVKALPINLRGFHRVEIL